MKKNIISKNGLDFIKKFEDLRLESYLPTPNDVWTIGYGTTRIGGRPVVQGEKITPRQATEYFREDILKFQKAVNDLVKVELTQNQFDALVSLVYNIGIGAFSKSTLLKKLNNGDYSGASREFKRWNKQSGRVLKGLTKRRNEEAEIFGYVSEEFEKEVLEFIDNLNDEEIVICHKKEPEAE
jgi:lysozyme